MAPVIIYSTAMRGESADLRLDLILLTSDAPPAEQSGQQLSQLAGTVAAAIEADPTLAGTAQWAHVLTASAASRIEWAGQTYMSSRLTLSIGSG